MVSLGSSARRSRRPLEALNESRIKRTHLNHIIVCPRLFTHRWRKRLQRLADVSFELPPGRYPFWPHSAHEPLILGIVLRFSLQSPWQAKQSPLLLELDRSLQGMRKSEVRNEWSILCQLCQLPGVLDSL